MARQVFEEKFPRQAHNEIKARLHIKSIIFHVRGEMYDEYGDEYIANVEFAADTSGKIVKKTFDWSEAVVVEKSADIGVKAVRKFFNVAVHNYDVSFWDTDLCHELSYDLNIGLLPEFLNDDFNDLDDGELDEETEQTDDGDDDVPDDRVPSWSVEIKYKNGTEQSIKGFDIIPNPVMELLDEFDCYFEDKSLDSEFDEDNIDGDGRR